VGGKGELVYSTGPSGKGDHRKDGKTSSGTGGGGSAGGGAGPTKMRLESGGRGGKQVTVLFNLPFSETEGRELLRTLQGRLGTGGTFKDGKIEIRGDVRSKVEEYFVSKGWKIVRAGG